MGHDFDTEDDQNTYLGRVRYYALITNPLNIFATSRQLEDARCLVTRHRLKFPLPPGTTREDLQRARILYGSAFHPESGEKMIIIGRMSAQVPVNMILTAGMMTFHKSKLGVIFWQWLNQSYNAVVNYSNRSSKDALSGKEIGRSYALATGGAVTTVLILNRLFEAKPLLRRGLAPMLAIAVANCINIPSMRLHELNYGTPIYDENGDDLGKSRRAAEIGTLEVLVSRLSMTVPGMTSIPHFVENLERRGVFRRRRWLKMVAYTASAGLILLFLIPLACGMFKQKASLEYEKLEPELRAQLEKRFRKSELPKCVYYNKGL